jgi:hypothetical protein
LAAGEPLREIALSYSVGHATICQLRARRRAAEFLLASVGLFLFWAGKFRVRRAEV